MALEQEAGYCIMYADFCCKLVARGFIVVRLPYNKMLKAFNSQVRVLDKMAVAWLIAECFIKFPEITYGYLKHSSLEKWTFNKAISKICDSYRVISDTKSKVKQLRR